LATGTFKETELALATRSPDRQKRLAARSTTYNERQLDNIRTPGKYVGDFDK